MMRSLAWLSNSDARSVERVSVEISLQLAFHRATL
jgi:hypothetical protein